MAGLAYMVRIDRCERSEERVVKKQECYILNVADAT